MVRINRVYTKAGDEGTTALVGGDRVSKASFRIHCYGTVDELNAVLGLVRTSVENSPGKKTLDPLLTPFLDRVQNELFDLGAQLATPDPERRTGMPGVQARQVEALEAFIDQINDDLPELRSFVLPGGGWTSSYCHLARTVCRRAERLVVELAHKEDADPMWLRYLNRLSDALFVIGRHAARAEGREEPLWHPESS
ncbi:MAG: cob(I)yrinic acid a,c-diamide adenosyltransferase [Proteobacteria bacterium]|nr:cob(I)yrinic acid a,c-diamide adenosyltransferase [Pseudomonadota bacterium]